jgi:predicted AAA+ superfamily ATPase
LLQRTLTQTLRRRARQYPVVTLTGPRQSGKTTLVRSAFPKHAYASLEDPELRAFADSDPRGFLRQFPGPVILDEVQRVPDLFSYIQILADEENRPGRFILSGSQNFLLLRSISQSLAGRTAVLHLLPFSLAELLGRTPFPVEKIGRELPRAGRKHGEGVLATLFQGFYPRIHDRDLEPEVWLADYVRTYVERDVREILNVTDLESFGRFLRLCAGRSGQLLNLSSLANDCGVTHTTARRWLSILEASFLIALLRPHHRNFGKRLIKAPKLYFLDTGLLCYLLRIRSPEELAFHASRGAIFESFVVSELTKGFVHRGLESDLYFWRDAAGHEVDLLIDRGSELVPVEVKSGETVTADFFRGLTFFRDLGGDPAGPAALVYGGERTFTQHGVKVYSWGVL